MSNDNWRTPKEVIDFIQSNFGEIKIDLCASDSNAVCKNFLDEDSDFLDDAWIVNSMIKVGDLCFCNCPYSNPLPFVKQCVKWASNGGYAVFMLLNNDSSTKWFSELVGNASVIMPITGGRLAFLDGDSAPVNGNNKPQVMAYFAPFGRIGELQTRYVSIDEIYPNGKPKRIKESTK